MKTLYLWLGIAVSSSAAFSQQNSSISNTDNSKLVSQVNLSDLKAVDRSTGVDLQWISEGETNMSSHEIQKSANGSSFTAIGELTAQNNGATYQYSFTDATPVEGINYYRLRSADKKGNVTFSDIIKADKSYRKTAITVLPNPVKGGVLNIQLSNFSKGRYSISLYSNNGQKVFSRSMDFSDGSFTETVNLPQNITRGSYFLQVTDGVSRTNTQVLVQ